MAIFYLDSGSFGNVTVTNITATTSSILYVTSSELNVSTNRITVNTGTPAVRFGGLAVIDSGSSPQRSGSILFDSTNNQWIFVHQNTGGAVTSSVFIQAPQTFNNVGNETTLTTNIIPKAVGGDLGEHIGDSNITDSGTKVSINSSTDITGSLIVTAGITGSLFGTASYVSNLGSFNVTQSFTNSSTWTFNHNLNYKSVLVQAYDSTDAQIIPQTITLTNTNTATLTFPVAISGYAVATVGGALSLSTASVAQTALTASSIGTLNQDVTLNGDLIFSTPSSPGFNGEVVKFGLGTLSTGQLYFLSSSGTWSLANADSTGSSTGMLGLAVGTSPTTNGLLIRGYAVSSSYLYGTGSIVYMATGSGLMTSAAPSSSNHVVRVLGYQTTVANTIYFDPDKTWVTMA